jgi:membrane protease YdiL (CAAX protease family)
MLLPMGLAILLREALIRGFCQRVISHWLHPLAGLFIVSGAWAVIAVLTGPGTIGILPLVSALGMSLVVGYLYYCSKNLIAACVLAALLELAPMIIKF